jgi:plastocyanin
VIARALARAALAAAALACVPAQAATHAVAIDGTAYAPAEIVVRRGDAVTWTNKDPFPHTVTARDGSFDSKSIAAGKSWRYVARKAGTFAYYCTLHPTMSGTLKVQ